MAPAAQRPNTDAEIGKLYPVAKAVLTPLFKAGWRVTVEDIDRIPTEGPAIFAPNHVSVLDSFFLPLVLPRRISYVGKAEYLDDWKTRKLFPAIGMVAIDRSGGDAAKRALDTAARILDRGEFFGIYPEGTRSRDGLLHKGHTGVARLAIRTGAPIVPVGLIGTREVQPPDAKVPKLFKRVTVRFGRPVDASRHCDGVDDHLALRQVTDEVMFDIRDLSGQEYVDRYATKKPEVVERPQVQVITAEGPTLHHANGAGSNGEPAPDGGGRRRASELLS